jgi:hypothetical protein
MGWWGPSARPLSSDKDRGVARMAFKFPGFRVPAPAASGPIQVPGPKMRPASATYPRNYVILTQMAIAESGAFPDRDGGVSSAV